MAQTHIEGRQFELLPAQQTDWSIAAWAGVIAGLVFALLEMMLTRLLAGQDPWMPLHMMAAMLLGPSALNPPGGFSMTVLLVAMLIHIPFSIVLGLIAGWLIHRLKFGAALIAGAVYGLAVYFINFYLIAPSLFPWFVDARNGLSAFNHMIFGLVLAWSYAKLRTNVS